MAGGGRLKAGRGGRRAADLTNRTVPFVNKRLT